MPRHEPTNVTTPIGRSSSWAWATGPTCFETRTMTGSTRESQFAVQSQNAETNGLPLRDRALSLNRLTWRSLSHMNDPEPGTKARRVLDAHPVANQLHSILYATRQMSPEEKFAKMSAFIRLVLEKVFQLIVENREIYSADPSEKEDRDNTMLMQRGITKVRESPEELRRLNLLRQRGVVRNTLSGREPNSVRRESKMTGAAQPSKYPEPQADPKSRPTLGLG